MTDQDSAPSPFIPIGGATSQSINRALSQALQQRLAIAQLPPMLYLPGQVAIPAGQPVSRLPLIVQGRIDAVLHSAQANGLQTVPIQFGAGEIVMLSYLFSQQQSTVDMVAGEPTTLRWIAIEDIETQVQAASDLAILLIRFLSQRLREVQGRERAWLERSVPLRVAAALVRMTSDLEPARGVWSLAVTHDQIAHRAGVSRPKASLAVKQLEREGLVRLGRGVVEILDLGALRAKTA